MDGILRRHSIPIASSSMPSSSTGPKGLTSEYRLKELLLPSRWSLLPPMIEEKTRCAAVNIPASGVLVIGGNGSNGLLHRFTELLTQRSDEEGVNKEHGVDLLAVYFQGRVYVPFCVEKVNEMEMQDIVDAGLSGH
ncbi:unnamed protein product [Hymenolepis diminuta]|uniref:PFK domain-containing protein n=1 Tax=Hymenolepis diminuta TaxID=6216 RepID=A0A0R3SXD7_HYMDI|nr:unnamed protein product [Hymenolepis diminuta]